MGHSGLEPPAPGCPVFCRARRRVQGTDVPAPDPDRSRQRAVVDAFFTAARGGDFNTLLAVLDPGVVLRVDFGPQHPRRSVVLRGATVVAQSALTGAGLADARVIPRSSMERRKRSSRSADVLSPFWVSLSPTAGSLEIDVLADPQRVRRIAATVLGSAG